jgi:hypothetical protein
MLLQRMYYLSIYCNGVLIVWSKFQKNRRTTKILVLALFVTYCKTNVSSLAGNQTIWSILFSFVQLIGNVFSMKIYQQLMKTKQYICYFSDPCQHVSNEHFLFVHRKGIMTFLVNIITLISILCKVKTIQYIYLLCLF